MNEQSNHEPLSRRQARRQRRAESRGDWVIGAILIVLGGLFLMQNMGTFRIPISNWWALFILIPAFAAFERAWRMYRDMGNQMTSQMSGPVLTGIVLTLLTLGFLINIGWTYFGPILIILVGLGMLFSGVFGRKG